MSPSRPKSRERCSPARPGPGARRSRSCWPAPEWCAGCSARVRCRGSGTAICSTARWWPRSSPRTCAWWTSAPAPGCPGIVLAIVRPDITVTLLEPLLRRTVFLEECVEALKLDNVEVLRGRAEEFAGKREFDVATARAVAPLDRLLDWSHAAAARRRRAARDEGGASRGGTCRTRRRNCGRVGRERPSLYRSGTVRSSRLQHSFGWSPVARPSERGRPRGADGGGDGVPGTAKRSGLAEDRSRSPRSGTPRLA